MICPTLMQEFHPDNIGAAKAFEPSAAVIVPKCRMNPRLAIMFPLIPICEDFLKRGVATVPCVEADAVRPKSRAYLVTIRGS